MKEWNVALEGKNSVKEPGIEVLVMLERLQRQEGGEKM